jgi:hypothetical protein
MEISPMNASNRLLWHTIDAATLKGTRNRHSGLGGTVFVLVLTLGLCVLALWADVHFV